MSDRKLAEALFLEHLGGIDRVASLLCARHAIYGAEAEDFGAWARMKVMEDDYAVLRKFRGEANVRTYLTTVVTRLFLTYVRERRGEWRPSTAAVRLDPPAAELEMLVRRDGYTLQQAGEKLRTGGRTTLSDVELARLLASLPDRPPLRPVQVGADALLDAAPGALHADERVIAAESMARRSEAMKALHRALAQLEPEDALIVRLHFADGATLADVARALRLEQKPLYRRVERLRTRLRTLLEDAGLRQDDVQRLLDEAESD